MLDLFEKTTQHNHSYVDQHQYGAPPEAAAGSLESAPPDEKSPRAAGSLHAGTESQEHLNQIAIRTSISKSSEANSDTNFLDVPPPPPKLSRVPKENIDQIPAHPKNRNQPRKKLQTVKPVLVAPSDEEIRQEGIVRIHQGEEKGVSAKEWIERGFGPRKQSPYRRGADANRKTIEKINALVQSDKPNVLVQEKRHCGMPRKGEGYDWELIEPDVLAHVAAGGTISSYAKATNTQAVTIYEHEKDAPEFKARLVEARRHGADALAAEALKIASTPIITEETIEVYDKNDELVTKSIKRGDNVHARKLAFNARMQLLEKWAPEKYGPNAKAEESGGMAEKLRMARARILSANKERQAERRKELKAITSAG